jgi:septum site-determining protein MinC
MTRRREDVAMNAARSQTRAEAFTITGTLAPITILRLKTVDVDQIEADLRARIDARPHVFLYAPVIVDLADLEADALELPLHHLAERLRACKLVPVGAANLPSMAVWNAAASGLAVVQLTDDLALPVDPERLKPLGAESPPIARRSSISTVTVRETVRSGQNIYAQDADLVVMASVHSGAEIAADGHIHVYGRLRGHAHAGAKGMADARIFCDSLEAEVIAINDRYLLSDQIPAEHKNQRVQIYFDNGFHIERR